MSSRLLYPLPAGAKALHFCACAWLALLAIQNRSLAVMAALAIIVLGVALEFDRKLVPGRGFEVRDMFINGAGVLNGIAIGMLRRRRAPVN